VGLSTSILAGEVKNSAKVKLHIFNIIDVFLNDLKDRKMTFLNRVALLVYLCG